MVFIVAHLCSQLVYVMDLSAIQALVLAQLLYTIVSTVWRQYQILALAFKM